MKEEPTGGWTFCRDSSAPIRMEKKAGIEIPLVL